MKRFAVIGLGRFGTKLAVALAMSGSEVIAIDKNRDEVEKLRDQVSHAVRLDSTDEEALKAQGVDKADVAIIAVGQENFEWVVKQMAEMAIRLAKEPRPQRRDLRWDAFFSNRTDAAAGGESS